MHLSEIHFHDSVVRRIVELPDLDELHMDIDYPVDWENERYEAKTIIFKGVLNYEVHEGDFAGAPTILDANVVAEVGDRTAIRLETNAGYRLLKYRSVELTGTERVV